MESGQHRDQIPVRQHHSLHPPSRPGRVQDRCRIRLPHRLERSYGFGRNTRHQINELIGIQQYDRRVREVRRKRSDGGRRREKD
ncbi:hypothetical protein AAC387_Pa02g0246 [Persea americana]